MNNCGSVSDVEVDTIVILCDSAKYDGGLSKVAINEAIELSRRGLTVYFFCPVKGVCDDLHASRVNVICLDQDPVGDDPNVVGGALRGLWNIAVLKELERLLERIDISRAIFHCHGYSKALSPSVGKILNRPDVRAIWTMHEYFLACPNGGFFDFQAGEICSRVPLSANCLSTNCDSRRGAHKAWRVLRQISLNLLGRLPSGLKDVIYISDSQRSVMEQYLPSGARLHKLKNPVMPTAQSRVRVEQNDAFLFVGRLEPDKGPLDFAEAASKLGVRAVFVGDGSERDAIKKIAPDAEVTGWLNPDGVNKLFREARCLVFPSLWYECQPLTPLEAAMAGVPVITGSWNAACEELEHNFDSLVYQDRGGIVECMRQMTPETAEHLSKNAFNNRLNYSMSTEAHTAGLLEIYNSILC